MRAGKRIISATLRQRIRFDTREQFERELVRLRCHYEVQDVNLVNGKYYVLIDKQYNDVPMDRSWNHGDDRLGVVGDVLNDEDVKVITALQQHEKLEASVGGSDVCARALKLICKLYDKCLVLND